MKKGDLILIGLVLLLALTGWLVYNRQASSAEGPLSVEIYLAGELQQTIPLGGESREIRLDTADGYNILLLEADGVRMLEADCSSQECLQTGKQHLAGSMIACLPHRVLVKLTGKGADELDAITF